MFYSTKASNLINKHLFETLKEHHNYRVIQESNSAMTIKDEDGVNIKLTVLKKPIPLNSLAIETEDTRVKTRKSTIKKFAKAKTKKKPKIALLEEPLALENFKWDQADKSSSINVKIVEGIANRCNKPKRYDYNVLKENALIIFENSFVYPFVHAGNKYKCYVCAKPFLNANLLKDHSLNEHNIEELKKELYNRVRDKHLKVDVTNLQCKLCLENVSNLELLKRHIKDHGISLEVGTRDNIIPFKLGADTFDCQVCGESFLKLRLLIIHMSKHYNNYSCEICGAVFISLVLLKRHLQTHESGSFPCDKCDKVFSNASKRTLHMRGVHLKRFPRRCPICPERFNSNYQRTKHLRIVHNETNGLFKCETCGREYDLKYHLLLHIRSVHLQERNHECPVCHSRFFSKYCLSRHMVVHTDEKNFKCGICGNAYSRRKNLKEHARSHEIGFCCSICGQSFGEQTALLGHASVAHGVLSLSG